MIEIGSKDTAPLTTAASDDFYNDNNDLITAKQLLFICLFISFSYSLQLESKDLL